MTEIRIEHFSIIAPMTLTIKQVCEYTNMGQDKVKKLVALGILEVTRPDHEENGRFIKGKVPLIFRESVEDYLDRNRLKIPKVRIA